MSISARDLPAVCSFPKESSCMGDKLGMSSNCAFCWVILVLGITAILPMISNCLMWIGLKFFLPFCSFYNVQFPCLYIFTVHLSFFHKGSLFWTDKVESPFIGVISHFINGTSENICCLCDLLVRRLCGYNSRHTVKIYKERGQDK